MLTGVLTDASRQPLARQYLAPVGTFGALVSFGLFIYELRAIRRCGALVVQGADIEDRLGVEGQFRRFPPSKPALLSHDTAGKIIYSSVLTSWIYLALMCSKPELATSVAIFLFVTALIASHFLCRWASAPRKISAEQLTSPASAPATPAA